MRARFVCSAVTALVLASSLMSSVSAQSLTADERLEAIRQSLVQRSLEGPTQVRSTQWVDGNGALRESNSFVTGMEVRGVRVLAYGRDMDQQPTATGMQLDGKTTLAPSCVSSAADGAVWHQLNWELRYGSSMAAGRRFEAQLIGQQFRQQVFAASHHAKSWRVSERKLPADGYEQLLVGRGEQLVPWVLRLTVSASDDSFARANVYNVTWELIGRGEGQDPVFRGSQQISINVPRIVGIESKPLSPAVVSQIQASIQSFQQGMEKVLSCQVPQFQVLNFNSGSVRIAGGAASGIRVGSQMVLADRLKLPQRALEQRALERIAMAEVVAVSDYYAELKFTAGTKFPANAQWVAIPHTP
jgi:hypothetical protein